MDLIELNALTGTQVSDLLALMRELNADIPVTPEMLIRTAEAPGTHLFAAVGPDGHIAGCASLCVYDSPTGRKAAVEDVVVAPAHRRQGIGRALMEHLIGFARRELAPVDLHLTSSPWRVEANAMYRALGFLQRDTNAYKMTI